MSSSQMPRLLVCLAFLAAVSPAGAHFKLIEPMDWLNSNATGDPTGGNQKAPPCGGGTSPTNAVTTVQVGAKLKIKLIETIGHPGHYRFAISPNRADFVTPAVTQVGNDPCGSTVIQATPVFPVIADGVFPHTTNTDNVTFETEITVPNTVCDNCTLQIYEFMSAHARPCFYYHCANLKIVPAGSTDGGQTTTLPDGGALPPVDAGTEGGSDAGHGGHGGTGGAGGTAGGSGGAGGSLGEGGGTGGAAGAAEPTRTDQESSATGGCHAAVGRASSLAGMVFVFSMLLALAALRRR